jgi:hypothetical protein
MVTVMSVFSGCVLASETGIVEKDVSVIEVTEDTEGAESILAGLEAVAAKASSKDYPDEESAIDQVIDLSLHSGDLKIAKSGNYMLTGSLEGQIIVDVGDEDVQLLLAGVTLSHSEDAPIYIMSADEATITLKSGTINTIVNTSTYIEDDASDVERTNGAIYSKADLAINGGGTLNIQGHDKTAILGKDDVLVLSGILNLVSDRHAIKGKDLLYIDHATITAQAGKDGLNSEVLVYINGGHINIEECNEGIEAYDVIINGGIIGIDAADDGINIANPDGASGQAGPLMGNGSPQASSHGLRINGGSITLSSQGDGLDSNESIWMAGGVVVVNGPTSSRDGSIDYDSSFQLSGGSLIAIGSLGMAMAPSENSSQNTLAIGFESAYEAGSLVQIVDESGKIITEYESIKAFQSLVVSSVAYKMGGTYTLLVDGQSLYSVTLAETITQVGEFSNQHSGGMGPRGGVTPEDGGMDPSGRPPRGGFPGNRGDENIETE